MWYHVESDSKSGGISLLLCYWCLVMDTIQNRVKGCEPIYGKILRPAQFIHLADWHGDI